MNVRRGGFLAVCFVALVLLGGGCRKGGGKTPTAKAGTAAYKPPPVAYVIGRLDVADDAAEPSVHLNVVVDPATSSRDIERLLNYFDKERYASYDIVWVNVFFDVAKARSPDVNPDALVATLRVNRPGYRELKLSEDLLGETAAPAAGEQPEVTTRTEETLYLGRRGRMFDSTKQAQALLDLMTDKPGHPLYRIVWQGPGEMELSYSVEQEMLVRVRTGVSRETWSGLSVEDVKRAARGAGFGGRQRHGGDYTYSAEAGTGAPTAAP